MSKAMVNIKPGFSTEVTHKHRKIDVSRCSVFFDFDNTITHFDVLDSIIKRFAVDNGWIALEDAWRKGRIGSKECLEGQLRSVRTTRKDLLEYLSRIRIDHHFRGLLSFLRKKGIEPVIVSDSFSFIIDSILKNNGIKKIRVYSNRLKFDKDRLIPIFPHRNESCPLCANCKKMHISNNGWAEKPVVYVGDGLSDICAARSADLVFAKESLLEHFKKTKIKCRMFKNLKDVYRYFQEAGNGAKGKGK
jgi:2,3-diketo-5-methylthio-1-phosphopentane phosphatase